ncbi:MAG: hypothetical protein ACK58H_20805 [Planctomyces sp.]
MGWQSADDSSSGDFCGSSACLAFVDVGELDWPVDVGEPEDAEPDQDGAGEP